jgi:tRNA A37 threonylcarbamoyltransferase TsaD
LAAVLRKIDKELELNDESILINGIQRKILNRKIISNICASVQNVITLQLEDRLKRALKFLDIRNIKIEHVVVSGGVASNYFIRNTLERTCSKFNIKISSPPVKYCTDNGVMIAWNGMEKLLANSNDVIKPNQQDESFFKTLIPASKCELGTNIDYQLKLLNIKN